MPLCGDSIREQHGNQNVYERWRWDRTPPPVRRGLSKKSRIIIDRFDRDAAAATRGTVFAFPAGTRIPKLDERPSEESHVMIRLLRNAARLGRDTRGGVFVEYLLLCTIVGIGVIVGLATLKEALINELNDLAQAIGQIVCS